MADRREQYPPNARILSVGTALPPHRFDQAELKELAPRIFGRRVPGRLYSFLGNSGVRTRRFALTADELLTERDVGERARLYVEHAMSLSEAAARRALDGAGVGPADVDRIVVTSTTGEPTPSLDARLQLALGLRKEHARPRPARGHGCAGGAEELGEAADWARTRPGGVVLVVAVELCSLALQPGDLSRGNLAGASLFGDGAAAVVLSTQGEGPEVLGADCVIWSDSAHLMGWRHDEKGLFLILDKEVPTLVRREVGASLRRSAGYLGLRAEDLRHFLMHPGGAKVLDAMEDALGMERGELALSRGVLADVGNLSSASVLFILERFLREGTRRAGELGVISAMGPGFRAEHVFFRC